MRSSRDVHKQGQTSIAPSTHYAHKQRQESPSARSWRDTELKDLIKEIFDANYRVYGARKIWRELNRQGHAVARCTVERLMREPGITGAVRGRKVITTIADPAAERAPDRLDRDFVADAPNRPGSRTSLTLRPGLAPSTSRSSGHLLPSPPP
ncbi:IS3 family transposase [Streptomyces sp. NBC_00828]|uniref:IS3 family transposase n=1 Tax=Streptomyces sp. NBC_00828 TaxID=2903678 RepID=UPI00386C4ECA